MFRFIRNMATYFYATMPVIGGLTGFLISAPSHADDAVRLSWQDFAKDSQRVAALRKAVATMKALNSADHSSAQYRGVLGQYTRIFWTQFSIWNGGAK